MSFLAMDANPTKSQAQCMLTSSLPLYCGRDAGDDAVDFLLVVDPESDLEDLVGKRGVGGKEGGSELGNAGVLGVEGGDCEGGVVSVGVELEVGEATGEDEEVALLQLLLEESVIGGGNESDHQNALRQEEHLGGPGVDVRRVQALGLEVDAGDGEALRVKGGKVGRAGEVNGHAEGLVGVARLAEQRADEVDALHRTCRLADEPVDGDLRVVYVGYAEVLQRVLVCCLHVNLVQVFAQSDKAKIKQEKVDEVVEEGFDKVYAERDQIHELIDKYANNWAIFKEVVVQVSDQYIALKTEKITQRKQVTFSKGNGDQLQTIGYDEFWEEIHARSNAKADLVLEDHVSRNVAQVNNEFQTKLIDKTFSELAHMAATSISDSCEEGDNFVVPVPHNSNLCSMDCSQEVQDDLVQGVDGPLSTIEACEVKQNNRFLEDDCIDKTIYTLINEVQELMESLEDVHKDMYELTIAANNMLTGVEITLQDEDETSDASLSGLREENAIIDVFLSDCGMYEQHITDDFSIASTYSEEVHGVLSDY
ncbi:hypothetical protein L7F22_007394 [Adiantum nelumboides]|nr:hypothetical protein [Adiantum nelumboides]